MKLQGMIEVSVSNAIDVLVEEGLSKEQAYELLERTGGDVRPMRYFPITVDEAISTISSVLIGGSSDNLMSESQQMLLYKGLAGNPKALSILANETWENSDVLDFLKARFGGKGYTDKQVILSKVEEFLNSEM